MKPIIFSFILLICFSLALVLADDSSFGIGDAVFNTIVRANQSVQNNVTTYYIVNTTQITGIEEGVKNISKNLDNHITSTNGTLSIIKEKVTVINSTVTEIYEAPAPDSTAAGLIFIFGVLILTILGILVYLVVRKKSLNLYRCQRCNKLFLVGDQAVQPQNQTVDSKFEVKGGKDGIPKDKKEDSTQGTNRRTSV